MTSSEDDLSISKDAPPLQLTSTIDLLERYKRGDE